MRVRAILKADVWTKTLPHSKQKSDILCKWHGIYEEFKKNIGICSREHGVYKNIHSLFKLMLNQFFALCCYAYIQPFLHLIVKKF